MKKLCRGCNKNKPLDQFDTFPHKNGTRYPRSQCRPCRRASKRTEYRKSYKSVVPKPRNRPGEVWVAVDGWSLYLVSNFGRVKRLNKGILRPETTKRGYQRVILSIGNKQRKKAVHRLVALAFIPNPEKKRTVNHVDGIKVNNRRTNLEWATQSENQLHAVQLGLQKTKANGHLRR